MADNVVAMPGCRSPEDNTPVPSLIRALQDLVARAEKGELQSFIGTGFSADGLRVTVWCDFHQNIFEQLGSIEFLKDEYISRHTTERNPHEQLDH